jgi:WD40 repeat protein
MDLGRPLWRSGPVPDPRLLGGFPVDYLADVAAIEHDGRMIVAISSPAHDEYECGGTGRHDCDQSVLRLLDFSTGADIALLRDAGGELASLLVIGGRLHAVSANWLDPVRCWDVASGEARAVAVPGDPVVCLATGPYRGHPAVLIQTTRLLQAWDLTTGDLVEQQERRQHGPVRAIGRLDGTWVLAGISRGGPPWFSRLDDDSHVVDVTSAGPRPIGMAVSGSILAVARAGLVELHDLAAGPARPALTGHTRWPALAPVNVGGRPHLMTGSSYGEVRLWDLTADAPAVGARHADPITAAAFVPGHDGEVLVTGDMEGALLRWRGQDGQPAGPPLADRTGPVRAVTAWRGVDRTVLATAGGDVNYGLDGDLRRWDLDRGTRIGAALPGHGGVTDRVAQAEIGGRSVFVCGGNDRFLSVWDAATGERVGHAETGKYPVGGLAVGPINGRLTAAVSRAMHQPIRFFSLPDCGQLELTGDADWNSDTVYGLITSDVGPMLVTADGASAVRVWTLDGRVWRVLALHRAATGRSAIAVTGRPRPMLAIGYDDGALELLDPVTLTPLTEAAQLPEPVSQLAFSESGNLAACYGIDVAVFTSGTPG